MAQPEANHIIKIPGLAVGYDQATGKYYPIAVGSDGQLQIKSIIDAVVDVEVSIEDQPARVATIDAITAKLATDALQDGLTALTPKFAIINAAGSGDNTLIAAVADKKIRVLQYALVTSAAITVRFESGAGGSALSGQMQFAANGGISVPFNPLGHFETAANTLLNLELSSADSVGGHLTYVEV